MERRKAAAAAAAKQVKGNQSTMHINSINLISIKITPSNLLAVSSLVLSSTFF